LLVIVLLVLATVKTPRKKNRTSGVPRPYCTTVPSSSISRTSGDDTLSSSEYGSEAESSTVLGLFRFGIGIISVNLDWAIEFLRLGAEMMAAQNT
jgi:hypothetical protein